MMPPRGCSSSSFVFACVMGAALLTTAAEAKVISQHVVSARAPQSAGTPASLDYGDMGE